MWLFILLGLQVVSVWTVNYFSKKKNLDEHEYWFWLFSSVCFSVLALTVFFVMTRDQDRGSARGQNIEKGKKAA